jgi:hypothetical protein
MRSARERARVAGMVELRVAALVRPGDRIAIPTSGHCETSPDASLEVLAIAGSGRPVFRVRSADGREDFYVPGREVRLTRGV